MPGLTFLPELRDHLETVATGHDGIEDDGVRPLFQGHHQSLDSIFGADDVVTASQKRGQALTQIEVVFDYQ
jgi:hypothetical protein